MNNLHAPAAQIFNPDKPIARCVWIAASPAAFTFPLHDALPISCEPGDSKRRNTPHSKRFATCKVALVNAALIFIFCLIGTQANAQFSPGGFGGGGQGGGGSFGQ